MSHERHDSVPRMILGRCRCRCHCPTSYWTTTTTTTIGQKRRRRLPPLLYLSFVYNDDCLPPPTFAVATVVVVVDHCRCRLPSPPHRCRQGLPQSYLLGDVVVVVVVVWLVNHRPAYEWNRYCYCNCFLPPDCFHSAFAIASDD